MAKKYLSLDEAAHLLKVEALELQRMRERGEIRGFQDRGNWRFREDEVLELLRVREDSNPDVPIEYGADLDESIFFDSDSDVKLASDENELGVGKDLGGSDSDVRLVFDETLGGPGSSGEVSIPSLGDSDSDVRLDAEPAKKEKLEQTWTSSDSDIRLDLGDEKSAEGSDSDVKLVGGGKKPDSDSDVKLVDQKKAKGLDDSDSDVKLTEGSGYSDSDVKLVQSKTEQADLLGDSDSDVKMVGELFDSDSDSDVKLTGSLADFAPPEEAQPIQASAGGESEELEVDLAGLGGDSDSDVSLVDDKEYSLLDVDAPPVWADDQKLPFESVEAESTEQPIAAEPSGVVDSGISLAGDDSDIALDLGDSGIALDLGGDSGIALDDGGDSGISLDLGADSGISLAGPTDSGIALEGPDTKGGSGFQQTIPQMNAFDEATPGGGDRTHVEVPMLGADDDEYALASDLDDTANSVPFLDEDDLAAAQAPRGKKKGPSETDGDLAVSIYDVEPSEEYAAELTDQGEVFGSDEGSMDVFDAADDVFQEGLQTGSSSAEFDMPVARKAAPVEAEWGTGVAVGLTFSTVLLALSGWVMFDLVRTMWVANDPSMPTGALLGALKGIFG